jgi:hypothetical protein
LYSFYLAFYLFNFEWPIDTLIDFLKFQMLQKYGRKMTDLIGQVAVKYNVKWVAVLLKRNRPSLKLKGSFVQMNLDNLETMLNMILMADDAEKIKYRNFGRGVMRYELTLRESLPFGPLENVTMVQINDWTSHMVGRSMNDARYSLCKIFEIEQKWAESKSAPPPPTQKVPLRPKKCPLTQKVPPNPKSALRPKKCPSTQKVPLDPKSADSRCSRNMEGR